MTKGTTRDGTVYVPEFPDVDLCHVRWGTADEYEFEMDVHLTFEHAEAAVEAQRKLHNLGHTGTLAAAVRSFQRALGCVETGELDDVRVSLDEHHDAATPPRDLFDIAAERFRKCSAKFQSIGAGVPFSPTVPLNPRNPPVLLVGPEIQTAPGADVWLTAHPSVAGRTAQEAFDQLPAPIASRPRSLGTTLRFAQTVGNPKITAPSDLWPQVLKAIGRAKKFIYMQDQYFWSLKAARALHAAVERNPDLQVVILVPAPPRASLSSLRRAATNELIHGLKQKSFNNVSVCRPKAQGSGFGAPGVTPFCYVHSKLWVFDDELAIVGSANCNARGYEHDSEVIGAWSDPDWSSAKKWHELELNLAHKLRIELWKHHLNLPGEAVHDPLAAALYWRHPHPQGRVEQLREDGEWWFREKAPGVLPLDPVIRWFADPDTNANRYELPSPAPVPGVRPPAPPPPAGASLDLFSEGSELVADLVRDLGVSFGGSIG